MGVRPHISYWPRLHLTSLMTCSYDRRLNVPRSQFGRGGEEESSCLRQILNPTTPRFSFYVDNFQNTHYLRLAAWVCCVSKLANCVMLINVTKKNVIIFYKVTRIKMPVLRWAYGCFPLEPPTLYVSSQSIREGLTLKLRYESKFIYLKKVIGNWDSNRIKSMQQRINFLIGTVWGVEFNLVHSTLRRPMAYGASPGW
jgi:hypothetical protein